MLDKDQKRTAQAAPPKVFFQSVESLVPYGRNARIHTDDNVYQLAEIIRQVGWTNPILVDGDGIVAGHKRRLAAMMIYADGGRVTLPGGSPIPGGMVPVIDVTGWTEAQRRAYILADNQTTMVGTWDQDLLCLEMSWLEQEAGIPLELTGFSGAALERALRRLPDDDTEKDKSVPEQSYSLIVVCDDEPDQQRKFEALESLGYRVKVLVN